jgi:magnesium and cobalt transporter
MANIFTRFFKPSIKDKVELISVLKQSVNNLLIKRDTMSIIEAAINITKLQAKDIMTPRMHMDYLDINADITELIDKIVVTGHSRFPVIDKEVTNIIGVLHTKDVVTYFNNPHELDIRNILRQTYFVPENKYLDELMYEMRIRQSHMAIIVDEFTNILGFVTLEMIVEQILGEIEDEHDSVDEERDIIQLNNNSYRIKGNCALNNFNAHFHLNWQNPHLETVGGFIIKSLGRIPEITETVEVEKVKIHIISADSRKINLIVVTVTT